MPEVELLAGCEVEHVISRKHCGMTDLTNPEPDEIWLADLGLAAKVRPVLIVSREDPEVPRGPYF